ncbi:hypothetical protein [Pseudomonas sp. MBLB4136]|uniref:hypothetical protein n=1 Tax=Pseudomonas sp. MBLB4136 TaxID=3451558 RepID=UPI003F74FB8F
MSNSNRHDQRGQGVADGEPSWPRDFDFRESYAEQRELLDGAPCAALTATSTSTKGAERHE